MSKLEEDAKRLAADLAETLVRLDFDNRMSELEDLERQASEPDFWQDHEKASRVSQRQAKLERRLAPWKEIKHETDELVELAKLRDSSIDRDLAEQLAALSEQLERLKAGLKLTGPYDANDAILSIQAGAGGTDAQDFAAILLRMYLRWAEKGDMSTKIVQESAGEEAGVKSVTVEVAGDFAYGKLKAEHGVHRLVRLSPFNTAHTRETSFAKVEVTPKLDDPGELIIDDSELKIDVYRSGGHGGQSVNTTDSAVRVTHIPTGIVVAIQNERSQLQNKETALGILRSKLAQLQMEQHAEKLSELKPPTGANEFGSQIRNYVLHPYKQVKDLRTGYQSSDPDAVLGGDIDGFIDAYLEQSLS
jgi:peptide chain release factor 2